MGPLNISQYVCFYRLCCGYFNVLRLTYFLLDQSIQLLDVRSDESMNPDQNLVFGQGGQEEAQRLHQPHALAALHTDAQEHKHTAHDRRRSSAHERRTNLLHVKRCCLTLWMFFSSASCRGTREFSHRMNYEKNIPRYKECLTCDTLRISSAKGPRSCLHSLQILFRVDTLDTDSSSFTRPWSTMGNILPIMTGWSASHSARDPAIRGNTSDRQETLTHDIRSDCG